MSYSQELELFVSAHAYESINAGGGTFRYVLSGEKNGKTLVFLNGGMNTLEMWMRYVDNLSADYQVLLFNYPQEFRTNQALVEGIHEFLAKLKITQPVFIGASDGGMVAQIYTQKYQREVGGLVLVSTGGMDAATIKSLKKKYFLAPLMLFYMKHLNIFEMMNIDRDKLKAIDCKQSKDFKIPKDSQKFLIKVYWLYSDADMKKMRKGLFEQASLESIAGLLDGFREMILKLDIPENDKDEMVSKMYMRTRYPYLQRRAEVLKELENIKHDLLSLPGDLINIATKMV